MRDEADQGNVVLINADDKDCCSTTHPGRASTSITFAVRFKVCILQDCHLRHTDPLARWQDRETHL